MKKTTYKVRNKKENRFVYGPATLIDFIFAPVMDSKVNKVLLIDNAQDDLIFLQNVGIKDKNGVDLYEGDIINFDETEEYRNKNYLTVFKNWYFCARIEKEWGKSSRSQSISGNWEKFTPDPEEEPGAGYVVKECNFTIIGNKYENPELLIDGQIE